MWVFHMSCTFPMSLVKYPYVNRPSGRETSFLRGVPRTEGSGRRRSGRWVVRTGWSLVKTEVYDPRCGCGQSLRVSVQDLRFGSEGGTIVVVSFDVIPGVTPY